jgi:hypothetical protein
MRFSWSRYHNAIKHQLLSLSSSAKSAKVRRPQKVESSDRRFGADHHNAGQTDDQVKDPRKTMRA